MIWICWISGVESDGACRQRSQRNAISSPVLPVKPTTVSRFCRAASIARKMFGERPEVDIQHRAGAEPGTFVYLDVYIIHGLIR